MSKQNTNYRESSSGTNAKNIKDVNISLLESFREVLLSNAREKVLYGGSGSGKTHVVQQYALLMGLQEPNAQSLVVMETQPGVLTGMFYPMKEMLYDMDIEFSGRETTPIFIRLPNNHTIWFISADKPEKIKYITNPKRVIINEATSLTESKFNQLMNRMGRTYEDAELIFTFNPIDHRHWLVEKYVNPHLEHRVGADVFVHHSTYRDNPYLAKVWKEWLSGMEQRDANFYRIYALGLPGTLEGLIFNEGTHWTHTPFETWPSRIQKNPPRVIGIDWGFNDPTAIVAIWELENKLWVHNILYASNMTQVDTGSFMERKYLESGWPKSLSTYCDPSRPEHIEDMKRRGFNTLKPDYRDIRLGISLIKEQDIIISSESTNMIKELRNYRWAEKNDRIIDEPVDEFNHAIDAMRYATAGIKNILDPNRFKGMVIR